MNIIASLREIGLSEAEADLYRILLKMGASPASTVAKEAGFKRTTAYSLLQNLKEKGFVGGYYKDRRQLFFAERPERVANRYERRLQAFTEVIPQLVKSQESEREIEGVHPINTVAELKNFYRDILNEYKGKSYRIIGNSQAWEGLDPDFFQHFRPERARNMIKTRLLLDSKSETINPKDPALLREWKYVPQEFSFDGVIDIYDDKVLLISSELRSLAVVIINAPMVSMFRTMFEIIWKSVRK